MASIPEGLWVGSLRTDQGSVYLEIESGASRVRAEAFQRGWGLAGVPVPFVQGLPEERDALHFLRPTSDGDWFEIAVQDGRFLGRGSVFGYEGEVRLINIRGDHVEHDGKWMLEHEATTSSVEMWLARAAGSDGRTEDAIAWLSSYAPVETFALGYLTPAFLYPELAEVVSSEMFSTAFPDPTFDAPELSQATHPIRHVPMLQVEMRDGVTLAAEAVLPVGEGPFPTVLARSPYATLWDLAEYSSYARRGYAVIIVTSRGRGASGGEFVPWVTERADGYDTIDWVSRQPWCDGNIGMIGGSYLGQTQWTAAVEAHPALKCIIRQVAGTDHMFDVPFVNGILGTDLLGWAVKMTHTWGRVPDQPLDWSKGMHLPLGERDDAIVGETVPIWDWWVTHTRASDWSGGNFLSDLDRINIPILIFSGWWDGESRATQRNFMALRALKKQNIFLVMGPWGHRGNAARGFAGLDYGEDALIDTPELYVRWFDTWLKGKDVGIQSSPRIRTFVTGENRWATPSDWPNANEDPALVLRLASTGSIEGTSVRGKLVDEAHAVAPGEQIQVSSASFRYDPNDAGAHRAVQKNNRMQIALPEDAADMVAYESDPLSQAITIAGGPILGVAISTTARDADLFAWLYDLAPDGTANAMTQPIGMRLSYLSGWDTPEPLEPGRVYEAELALPPLAHRFAEGHRIGLLIRGDWLPSFEHNLGTGEPRATGVNTLASVHRIHHGHAIPCELRLPLFASETPAAGMSVHTGESK